jgi:hypothetical protein
MAVAIPGLRATLSSPFVTAVVPAIEGKTCFFLVARSVSLSDSFFLFFCDRDYSCVITTVGDVRTGGLKARGEFIRLVKVSVQ